MSTVLKLALFLVGFCALCLLGITACVAADHGDVHFGLFESGSQEKSERVDTRDLHLAAGQKLSVNVPFGAIHVRAGEPGGGSVRARITAHGSTQAEADDLLARTTIVVDETQAGAAVRVDLAKAKENSDKGWPSVDFEIAVPAGLEVTLDSKSGEVRADGDWFATSSVSSSFGDVRIENVRGNVVASSSSGKVHVSGVKGDSVDAHSGFGDVALASIESTKVTVNTGSGNVKLGGVRTSKARVESGFGKIELSKVEGDLEVKSSSGDVSLDAITGRAAVNSGFGALHVRSSTADFALETSSGDIDVSDVHSKIEAKTGFGSIAIDGVIAALSAKSSSGDVRVRARGESRIGSEWNLESNFGKVELVAPPSLAFELSAKTGFGRVRLGYGIEIRPGEWRSDSEVHGRVNGGGAMLRMTSQSGDVVLTPSKD
jgi:DUF4097 and DUF4098 domain-containing protein YvlB